MSLTLSDNVVVTDLAYEKAHQLGMSLVSPKTIQPPAAPIRPYISKEQKNESIELKIAQAPSFINFENNISFNKRELVSNTSDPIKAMGLTAMAVTQNDTENTTAGYPKPTNATRIDSTDLRHRVHEEVQLRFGKVDPALLEKTIQRVFTRLGIE